MRKTVILLLSILGFSIGIFFAVKNFGQTKDTSQKLQVTASFYPYYFFASQIGGNKTEVTNITPAGGEPHDYEPSSGDIVKIDSSKLLILNGAVEPWGSKIQNDLKGTNTKVLIAGAGLFTQKVIDEDGIYSVDSHIWLSPKLAKTQVTTILNEFNHIDPTYKNYFTANANKLINDLNNLDKDYKTGLIGCQKKDIITSHAAFGYLATEYGLTQIPIAGLSPDAEPSLKQLADISNFAKTNNIKYIFFESLVSPKLAQTIATEVGAQTLVLDPLEGLTPDALSHGANYLTVMEQNLHNLRVALECK
ncbi:MAG TPA: zinc ABC transporter substrate-binding protein [Candidatus Saccharimonadales bacterium]|jgi:zinc transport system substrate-binding protein|nr:zinc ABC transporter substrate-binding protein [Candidatus Saccharimonadales bacterium]